jgi:hypothetical protein
MLQLTQRQMLRHESGVLRQGGRLCHRLRINSPRIFLAGLQALLVAPPTLGLGHGYGARRDAPARQERASAMLLVRGETRLTGDPLAWRVVSDAAETPGGARRAMEASGRPTVLSRARER